MPEDAILPESAVEAAIDPIKQQHYDKLFNFNEAKPRLQMLHQKWTGEMQETQRRRLLRNVDLSPKKLRDDGKLKSDETIIPIRLCDTNIRREQPAYINYLISPQRAYIFSCTDKPNVDTQQLEKEVTDGLRYIGWETPHFKVLDGSQTHGWDAVEVVFDPTKPLHVALEHVGHENLFFSLDALDTNNCEVLVRRYSFSPLQLKEAVTKYGFNAAQVDLLLQSVAQGTGKEDNNVVVYKKLCKYEGVIYVAWYDIAHCQDWLKAPTKLFLGIRHKEQVPNPAYHALEQQLQTLTGAGARVGAGVASTPSATNFNGSTTTGPTLSPLAPLVPAQGAALQIATALQATSPTVEQWVDTDIVEYPIFLLPYAETEEQTIVSHKGRVFFDNFKQEAMTAIASGYVNGVVRASNVYGAVSNSDPSSTSAPKQLETALNNGAIFDKKIDFFHTDYPEASVLSGLQYFDVQNSQETGQVNFSAANRKDSRKTATEMEMAQQQQQMLSSVQVSLYSNFLRKVGAFQWLIIQSQALQDKINLLLVPAPQPQLNMQAGTFEEKYVNDYSKISLKYNVKPAGDVDVIERQQFINQMMQDWPVLQNTPLANEFLKELVRRRYPSIADKWTQLLDQADPRILLAKVAQIGTMLADPTKLAALSPQDQQVLQQIMAEVQAVTAPMQQSATQPAPAQPTA